jgi:putative flippase GtrA
VQGLRFVLSGGFVALVYIATTSVLSQVVGVPFQIALTIGFTVAIATHFLLQRRFVWTHVAGFALPLRHQAIRYLSLAAIQYGLTVASTATLPTALGVSTEIVYLSTAATLSAASFLLFRSRVFHPAGEPVDLLVSRHSP